MNKQRFMVSDGLWRQLEPHFLGKVSDSGVTAQDNRPFLEAVFLLVRTGSPWRDLLPTLGDWNSQFLRFKRWMKAGVFDRLFNSMSDHPDLEYAQFDGTIVSAHQKAPGAKGGLSIRLSGACAAG